MGRGLDLAKLEIWRERLGRFESAGLTVADFCRVESVSIPSYYQWRRRLREEQASDGETGMAAVGGLNRNLDSGKRSSFVAVRLRQFSQVEMELGNGVSLGLPAGDLESLKTAILAAGQLSAVADRTARAGGARSQTVRSC